LGKLAKGACRALSFEEKHAVDQAMRTAGTKPVIYGPR